ARVGVDRARELLRLRQRDKAMFILKLVYDFASGQMRDASNRRFVGGHSSPSDERREEFRRDFRGMVHRDRDLLHGKLELGRDVLEVGLLGVWGNRGWME